MYIGNLNPAIKTAKLSFSFEHLGGFEVDQDVVFCDDLSLLALKQLTQ